MFVILDCTFLLIFLFFFNDTATTEIYTLSLHDALPICRLRCTPPSTPRPHRPLSRRCTPSWRRSSGRRTTSRSSTGCPSRDRKSTRLNSSHSSISYAVFCLKKKKKKIHYLYYIQNNPTI